MPNAYAEPFNFQVCNHIFKSPAKLAPHDVFRRVSTFFQAQLKLASTPPRTPTLRVANPNGTATFLPSFTNPKLSPKLPPTAGPIDHIPTVVSGCKRLRTRNQRHAHKRPILRLPKLNENAAICMLLNVCCLPFLYAAVCQNSAQLRCPLLPNRPSFSLAWKLPE